MSSRSPPFGGKIPEGEAPEQPRHLPTTPEGYSLGSASEVTDAPSRWPTCAMFTRPRS